MTTLNGERANAPDEDFCRLTLQLKLARDQIDKKSELCDGLAAELRRLEVELEAKTAASRDSRELLRSAHCELRAARQAGQAARAEHEQEAAALRESNDKLRREALERQAVVATVTSAPATPLKVKSSVTTPTFEGGGSASVVAAALSAVSPGERRSVRSAMTPTCAAQELADLRLELARERELHQEAVRLLQAQRINGDVEVESLQQELANVAAGLEQKEEEVLSIQFDMVTLQNRLRDQVQLVNANAEAFQQASEELADKEEALQEANERQEELLAQINTVSEQLQGKITRLSEELEASRAAYQALEEQTRSKVSILQTDRDALASELQRVRSDADAQLAAMRAELQQQAAAEALRASIADELRMHLADFAPPGDDVVAAIKEQLRSSETSITAASMVAVASLEEPPAEDTEGEVAPSTPPQDMRRSSSPSATVASAARVAMEDRLAVLEDQLSAAQAEIDDLKSALARSRLIERQAIERAQEYRTSLELYREFGAEFFADPPVDIERSSPSSPLHVSPGGQLERDTVDSVEKDIGFRRFGSEGDDVGEVALRRVLISVELDLGVAGTASITVAPWQTRSDFDGIVSDFLQEHKVKPLFADALIAYLQEVEAQAKTFPVYAQANLSEIFSVYG